MAETIYTSRRATCLELLTPGARGSADGILSVALERGAWELDVRFLDFGLVPVPGLTYAADVRVSDRVDSSGKLNGQAVTVVGLRAV